MRYFLCMALREIQYGRKREALLAQRRGGPCDGQTRQESCLGTVQHHPGFAVQ